MLDNTSLNRSLRTALATAVAAAVTLAGSAAMACGCLSPPEPIGSEDFAVNQEAEQIIFEVDEEAGTVTAHVLIAFQGSPEEFAWLVPVPSVPDLELSHSVAFGLLDEATTPTISVANRNICPTPTYTCRTHPAPSCPSENADPGGGFVTEGGGDFGGEGAFSQDTSSPSDEGAGGPVQVLAEEIVGEYQTVVFAAEDATLAVDWLLDNGFIVNQTMTPYMQPYLDAEMVFVAAKLVPGAGLDAIRPLRMTYEGTMPMIPLQLTAVAAEPELTVTALIYSDVEFAPIDHPIIDWETLELTWDNAGRVNYPMALSRAIDDAGGDGFAVEYAGQSRAGSELIGLDPVCCGDEFDTCGAASDGLCQCPGLDFDAEDCAAEEGLLGGIELLNSLAEKHSLVTRITTRLSPEEMTFDPMFEPAATPSGVSGRMNLTGEFVSLAACEAEVLDTDEYQIVLARQACASTYCGAGECVIDDDGRAGCLCPPGFAARRFRDYDGLASVTCIPEVGTVDLGLDTQLPDVCAAVACGSGECIDVGGFPACKCDPGSMGWLPGDATAVTCSLLVTATGSPGAEDFSQALRDLDVCAPPAPICDGPFSWLEPIEEVDIEGVECYPAPAQSELSIPAEPTCASWQDYVESLDPLGGTGGFSAPTGAGREGGGCRAAPDSSSLLWLALGGLFIVVVRRRIS